MGFNGRKYSNILTNFMLEIVGLYTSKLIAGTINECIEVIHLRMIATASLDK
jgi:hypothetical protein